MTFTNEEFDEELKKVFIRNQSDQLTVLNNDGFEQQAAQYAVWCGWLESFLYTQESTTYKLTRKGFKHFNLAYILFA